MMKETRVNIRGKPIEELTKEQLIDELIMAWKVIDNYSETLQKYREYDDYLRGWAKYTSLNAQSK